MKSRTIATRRIVRNFAFVGGLILLAMVIAGAGDRAAAEVGSFEINSWERSNQDPPSGAVKLRDLEVEVEIEGGFARVLLRQTFMNRTSRARGGSFYLRLPSDAVLMNFGAWDGGRWTEAVVMERRQARSAFDEIVQREVDPALMEAPEAEITDAFKVAVAPIAAYGTARVETSYHQWLKVRSLERRFVLALKPGQAANAEAVDHIKVKIKVKDSLPLGPISAAGPTGMNFITKRDEGEETTWEASYEGGPLPFDHDLTVTIPLALDSSRLTLQTFRDAESETLDLSPTGGTVERDPSGYFLVEAINRREDAATGEERPPRDVVALFDTSMSMQGDKLTAAMMVLESVMSGLGPHDRFNLVTMDARASAWSFNLSPTDSTAQNNALEFLRRTPITTGTSLEAGLTRALKSFRAADGRTRQVVAITDGQATLGRIDQQALLAEVLAGTSLSGGRVAIDCFGVGEDTNTLLLEDLAGRSGGYFIWARESEDLGSKLASFARAILEEPILGVRLGLAPAVGITDVYPAEPVVGFNLESLAWVGRYTNPQDLVKATVSGTRGGRPVTVETEAMLPERSTGADYVRRLWAERRVEHLLKRIRLEGEKEEWVSEIVNLSRRFKFPTPYTSYLVAPRAFLRPRVIRPRDPVLRVKTEPGTRAVVALFPFGEIKRLRHLAGDDVWETRFLAPEGMRDGRYFCRLLITDRRGAKHMEYKDFIIDSRPPRLKLIIKGPPPRPGRTIELLVDADPDTRTIRAGLAGLPRVPVKWDPEAKICRGKILIPPDWVPGDYDINVWAEDFAHNAAVAQARVRIGG